jgi:hypothetical protein
MGAKWERDKDNTRDIGKEEKSFGHSSSTGCVVSNTRIIEEHFKCHHEKFRRHGDLASRMCAGLQRRKFQYAVNFA